MILLIVLSVLFIVLNMLDWYLTKRILNKGGVELNPVLRVVGIWQAKLVLIPIVIVIAWFTTWVLLAIGCAAGLFAVIWNLIQLRRANV